MDDTGRPWLVADIGGTHARFGLQHTADGPVESVQALRGAGHAGVEAAALAYLDGLGSHNGRLRPGRVALALACPIDGETVTLTNRDWVVSRRAVATALGASEVRLLNDFEALALALPGLNTHDTAWIGTARPEPRRPMAVIGPGTGLGVAACLPTPGGWTPLASEGGHASLTTADDFEAEVLRVVRTDHAHVSAERLLSGPGLPLLHRAMGRVRGMHDASVEPLTAEELSRRAFEQRDADCLATLEQFAALLGGFAGNVALTLGARGGIWLAGGVAQKLGIEFFRQSRFRARFEAKGRFEAYLAGIATGLLVAPHAALAGAARALTMPPPRSR